MSRRRWVSIFILAGIALAMLLLWRPWPQSVDHMARQKLDKTLTREPAQPSRVTPAMPFYREMPEPPGWPPFPFGGFPERGTWLELPGLASQAMTVQETPEAYQVRVPLTHVDDAERVQVNVGRHRVSVSASLGNPGMRRQMVQNFSTSKVLKPEAVRRDLEKTGPGGDLPVLVITIPKQQSDLVPDKDNLPPPPSSLRGLPQAQGPVI